MELGWRTATACSAQNCLRYARASSALWTITRFSSLSVSPEAVQLKDPVITIGSEPGASPSRIITLWWRRPLVLPSSQVGTPAAARASSCEYVPEAWS